jgi:uncharacterized RDD family membrane protein YckC
VTEKREGGGVHWSMDSDSLKHAPRGYLSEESKRKFTLTAGILGAVFFFGQMLIPFVLMMIMMPAMMFGGAMDFSMIDLRSAEAWKNQIWTVSRNVGHPGRPSGGIVIRSLAEGADAKPVERGTVPVESAWLLAAPDRLWVISDRTVRFITDAGLSEPLVTDPVNVILRPFLYKGAPALIQRTPDGLILLTLGKEGWRQETSLHLGTDEFEPKTWDVRVLPVGDWLHVFRNIDGTIYHRARDATWTSVTTSGRSWSAILIGDRPVVFSQADGPSFSVRATRLEKGKWEPYFSHDVPGMMRDIGVVSTGPDRFSLLAQGFPGSLRIYDVVDGKVVGERKAGKGFPFPGFFMGFFVLIQGGSLVAPLLLAVILSGQMARHRVTDFGAGDQKLPFGSLTRRAFAQLIDSAIEVGPMMIPGFLMMSSFEDVAMSPQGMLKTFGLMGLGFVWVAFTFVLFSWTEGRTGWTPGKGLMGIRVVGIDLQPCGFGRALVRNLLKFADGFMNFLVGILVSALSENWQRVGDMAARTVVVRADAYRALRNPRF